MDENLEKKIACLEGHIAQLNQFSAFIQVEIKKSVTSLVEIKAEIARKMRIADKNEKKMKNG